MKERKLLLPIILAVILIVCLIVVMVMPKEENTTKPVAGQTTQQTTNESGSIVSTDPVETTVGQQSTDPTETTAGQQSTDPTETTAGQQSTDPTETTAGDKPTKPTEGTQPTKPTESEQSTEPTENDNKPAPTTPTTPDSPEDLPPSVEIPTEGEDGGITFPCPVPGYSLTIEKLAPYKGMYVEDGSNKNVSDVAMILLRNEGDYPVEYALIHVQYEKETLLFEVSALPVGEAVVVQEHDCKSVPEGQAKSAVATIVRREEMDMSEDKVSVTDNGNNTITIKNLTKKTIPTVRVFYKYYMQDEEVFVGGIAFTVRLTKLAPGKSVTIQPNHFTSATGRIVMVLTYDSEV